MGISGLLQFIKDAAEPINVKKYKGQTVAVDTYCWLHKGAFSCAEKLAKGEPTDQYVQYCMKLVDMLLTYSVKPILVFDGQNLPSKREVEKSRRQRREANLQKGRQLLRQGKLSEARECFTRSVNITPAMAHNLIKAARSRGVDCIVAPYEADAQLAYFTKSDLAQAVITEDSDLLAFGCKKVILKMDKQGNGLEIDRSNLGRCRSLGNIFTEEKFRYMCILSGCDYLPSIHGIGLAKACKLLRLAKDPDIVKLVFDPVRRKVVPLNPYPEHIDPAALTYAGLNVGDDKGLQMALGNLDINTLEQMDDFNPDIPSLQLSIHRSHSWNNLPASFGPSIWSEDIKSDRFSFTRGKEGIVNLAGLKLSCRELQVKRPREDSTITDQDVLQQYSVSIQKRSKHEQPLEKWVPTSQPRPRNCFTTLLQRRNQEAEEDSQGTCSRFFSSSSSADRSSDLSTKKRAVVTPTQDKSCHGIKTGDCDGPEVPSIGTPSPPSPITKLATSASQGLREFSWSGNCSYTEPTKDCTATSRLSILPHYKGETFSSSPKTNKLSGDISSFHHLSSGPNLLDNLLHSPPSKNITINNEDIPNYTPPAFQANVALEMNSSKDSEQVKDTRTTITQSKQAKKSEMLTSKISGLSKLQPSSKSHIGKGQTFGPARASGLRKRCAGSQREAFSPNNENKPGVQTTISSLWKNFSFRRDTQKMCSCKPGAPMSPVKDNLLDKLPQRDRAKVTSL
ncbi:exonuclease 1 isoform X2 [Betta splendens]|uniref:Exonuclease 1 n=1 Tax=Betta splendens TaxID=158456 RepID=A0A6P7KRM0_BETSP|nr:exonuclease 1 isoform X2 [Betta splendens]